MTRDWLRCRSSPSCVQCHRRNNRTVSACVFNRAMTGRLHMCFRSHHLRPQSSPCAKESRFGGSYRDPNEPSDLCYRMISRMVKKRNFTKYLRQGTDCHIKSILQLMSAVLIFEIGALIREFPRSFGCETAYQCFGMRPLST